MGLIVRGFSAPGAATPVRNAVHWHDQRLAARHRLWGRAPMVDLDCLEYSGSGVPVALIEYKYQRAPAEPVKNEGFNALKNLANGYYPPRGLPFFYVRYRHDFGGIHCTPCNPAARAHFKEPTFMCEAAWVQFLHQLRRVPVPAGLIVGEGVRIDRSVWPAEYDCTMEEWDERNASA